MILSALNKTTTHKNMQKSVKQMLYNRGFSGKRISLIQKYFGGWRHSKHTIPCLCQWNVGTVQEQCPGWRALEDKGKHKVVKIPPLAHARKRFPCLQVELQIWSEFYVHKLGFQNLVPSSYSCIL